MEIIVAIRRPEETELWTGKLRVPLYALDHITPIGHCILECLANGWIRTDLILYKIKPQQARTLKKDWTEIDHGFEIGGDGKIRSMWIKMGKL